MLKNWLILYNEKIWQKIISGIFEVFNHQAPVLNQSQKQYHYTVIQYLKLPTTTYNPRYHAETTERSLAEEIG